MAISSLHLWVAVGCAALLAMVGLLAVFRASATALRVDVLLLGAALGAGATWAVLDRASGRDLGAERRALELRANELTVRTLAPSSPLACLDALAGENVEAACEKAIFASPASVAGATSYVAARLAQFSEIVDYVGNGGAGIDDVMLPLRHALEADRFGFVAHALAMRDGCTEENCRALALLHDPTRVQAHLSAATFDQLVDHYATMWAQSADAVMVDATQAHPAATTPATPAPTHKGVVNIDFPTAASIPAVNIMSPEATGPVLPGVAAAAAANPNPSPASSSHRSRKQVAAPAAQAAAQSTSSAANEPIWPEPVPPSPRSAAIAPGEPVRLTPSPDASAGTTVRAQ